MDTLRIGATSHGRIPATKQDVVLALNSGVLSPGNASRRYGKVARAELCRRASVDPTQSFPLSAVAGLVIDVETSETVLKSITSVFSQEK
jgi:hypothetical protein